MRETDRPRAPTDPTLAGTRVHAWLREARGALQGSAWSGALKFHAVDLFDAALSPLYADMLRAARQAAPTLPATDRSTAWAARLRRYALDRRLPQPVLEWRARRRSSRPPRDGILFWPREPTHVQVMLPVASRLDDAGAGCITCQPHIFAALENAGRDATLTRAQWPDLIHRVAQFAEPLLHQLEEPPGVELPSTPPLGMDSERLAGTLRRSLGRYIPTVIETVLATEHILDECSPRALVVGNDLTLEGRTATRVAGRLGTPTASLMHGAISGDPLQRHHIVDRFLVYGELARRRLLDLGVAAERIAVTGNPRLSRRPEPAATTHPRIADRLGLPPGKAWLLVATSGPGHRTSHAHHRELVASLSRLADELPELRLVVKLHRKDRVEYYPRSSRLEIVPYDAPGLPTDIFDWLRGCRAVLTGASTVAIEAMLASVPVLTVDLARELRGIDFIDAGVTRHATSHRALHATLAGVLAEPGFGSEHESRVESYLREMFAHLDGGSASVAAATLLELTQP